VPRLVRKHPNGALREQLADEAARLMIEQGIGDYSVAKRKAAERFGMSTRGVLPSNREIEQSVEQRQRIFEPDERDNRINALRGIALSLMKNLSPFSPRLTGSVLAGTATRNALIELHVFCDTFEDVGVVLQSDGHDLRAVERRLRLSARNSADVPGFRLIVAGAEVLILVFPEHGIRQAPLSPVDRRPMKRASAAQVARLLQAPR
jgi:hypothetical protein